MPERLLDEANILGLAIEFRRKGMPQHVWVDILVPEPRFLPPPFHHRPQGRTIDRRALARRKEQAGRAGRPAGAPVAQLLQERFVEPEDAILLALALPHGELAAEPVDIVDSQGQLLGGAQTGM